MSPLIQHALVLHLYQPPGSLQQLLRQDEEELRRILLCYERIARHAHKYADVACMHVVFSVPLLEQLRAPALIDGCRHLVDVPAILEAFRSASNIEFVGSGYQHAPLPLIPHEDWEEQLRGEREVMETVLGRVPKAYWPPEAVFSMEMVPALVDAGYEYVLLGSSTLVTEDDQPVDPYRTYQLSYKGDSITVVPWDAGFSQAQEQGLDAPWLADELRSKLSQSPASDAPYLLTSCSDVENGEWFRREDEEEGFFGHFFSPYMEFCETGEFPIRPENLTQYIRRHPVKQAVSLRNDITSNRSTWDYPAEQKTAFDRSFTVSERYWSLVRTSGAATLGISREALAQARKLILQAQGSCYLFGHGKQYENMTELLEQAESLLGAEKEAPTGAQRKRKDRVVSKSKKQNAVETAKKSAAVGDQAVAKKTAVSLPKSRQGEKQALKASDNKPLAMDPLPKESASVPARDEKRPPQKKISKKQRVAGKRKPPQEQEAKDEAIELSKSLGAVASPQPPNVVGTDKAGEKELHPAAKKTITTPPRK
jgi:hypothetical protein